MEGSLFRCRHCSKIRIKRSRDQWYCGSGACQKARKNAWRRAKYELDPDYRANQRESSKAWLASQGGSAAYHRRYRQRRQQQPRYAVNAEHAAQPERTAAAAANANSDAELTQSRVTSGRYRLSPCDTANSDAILVELTVIPDS